MAFRCKLVFQDQSVLWVRHYVFEGQRLKYSFHWQSIDGKFLCRWDNEPHWPDIETHPHHCHYLEGNSIAVRKSYVAGDVEKVLIEICNKLSIVV
jgi:hypothetical protein